MTEAELKQRVLRLAYAHGWLVYHVPATTVRGSQGRGYPDLTLAKALRDPLWLELKQEDGRLRADQQRWADTLPPGQYYVIRPSDMDWLHEVLA